MWLKIPLQILIRATYDSGHKISTVVVSLKISRQPSSCSKRFETCLRAPPQVRFSLLAQVARTLPRVIFLVEAEAAAAIKSLASEKHAHGLGALHLRTKTCHVVHTLVL